MGEEMGGGFGFPEDWYGKGSASGTVFILESVFQLEYKEFVEKVRMRK